MYFTLVICLSVLAIVCDSSIPKTAKPHFLDVDSEISPHNSCLSTNPRANCVTEQQEAEYTYQLTNTSQMILVQEYLNDKLSDKDQLILKSRDSNSWRAKDQETLKQVLLIHRHGDRTPIEFSPKDNLANEPFWKFHGLGQLTNRGKSRVHALGKIIRQRYDKFLLGSVNKNLRTSHASGSLRCIESAQVFLSSFLSMETTSSPDAKSLIWDNQDDRLSQIWQPASINTLAAKYDALLNEGAECRNVESEYAALDNSTINRQLFEDFKDERDILKKEIGFEIDHFYKWFWASSLIEVERSYFPGKIKPALLNIYDRLQQAGDIALVLYQSSLKLRRIRVGLLIYDFIKKMEDFIKSPSAPNNKKFIHYSAHDINLAFLLGVLENIDKFPHRPDYAANIILELHQYSNDWFVRIFYMSHVPSKPIELYIEDCTRDDELVGCSLNKFNSLMQKYIISSWMDWMRECGNPINNINPYEPNS